MFEKSLIYSKNWVSIPMFQNSLIRPKNWVPILMFQNSLIYPKNWVSIPMFQNSLIHLSQWVPIPMFQNSLIHSKKCVSVHVLKLTYSSFTVGSISSVSVSRLSLTLSSNSCIVSFILNIWFQLDVCFSFILGFILPGFNSLESVCHPSIICLF